jgi:sugar lactone lactonase YvrE
MGGFAMLTTLLLLMLLTTSVTTAIIGSGLQTRIASNLQQGMQARYLAYAGIQHALYQLQRNVQWRTGIPQTPLGNGTYTVSVNESGPQNDISLVALGKVASAERTIILRLRTVLVTVAGTGSAGYNGDSLPATSAELRAPTGVFVDAQGNLFIADRDNDRVRRVVPGADGILTGAADELIATVAGTGTGGYSGDGIPATTAKLHSPAAVLIDAQGSLLIADLDNERIRRVVPGADGVLTGAADELIATVAGTGAGGYSGDGIPATTAKLRKPAGMFLNSQGNLFIADRDNERIRRVVPGADGVLTGAADELIATVAGTGAGGYSGDALPAILTKLQKPTGVFGDAQGNLFIADRDNERVRKVDALLGLISTVAGTGAGGYNGDGILAILAKLHKPTGVFGDAQGNLFIADRDNERIRKVEGLLGSISTVAGTGAASDGGSGGVPTATPLDTPSGLCFDAAGNLFIADTNNHRVRKMMLRILRWEAS